MSRSPHPVVDQHCYLMTRHSSQTCQDLAALEEASTDPGSCLRSDVESAETGLAVVDVVQIIVVVE